ncbi:MAG TPA: bifunctional diguanylate cyclase/phosphodiesterase [Candidatus Dormibacteraeota bacterium]|nr:bifunctional diguanylate cyclase/phosphodiesterase [Candidatus Dormibacteraeota bacterium]
MTTRKASTRALVASLIAVLCGSALLRATTAREAETRRAQARTIGAAFGHRLETEFERLGAVSETLALVAHDRDCDALRPLFQRLIETSASIQGVWQARGGRTCAFVDQTRFPERDTRFWRSDGSVFRGEGATAVRGPFASSRGNTVVLVVHRTEATAEGPPVSTTLLVDLLQVLSASGLDLLGNAGYQFALRRSGEESDGGPPFLGAPSLSRSALDFELNLPGAAWRLAVAGSGGWYATGTLAAGLALVLAFGAAIGLSTYGLLRQPELLLREVELRKERLSRARLEIDHEATERGVAEQRLEQELTRDPLTGLYNRRSFAEQLRRALGDAGSRPGCPLAVLTLDLDGFTRFNNTLGHAFGDRFICHVADQLRLTLREEHAAARIGPDEFAVLILDCKSADIVGRFAGRLQSDLGTLFRSEGEETSMTASIGIAIGEGDGAGAGDLLRDAGIAMVQARDQGGARHVLFERKMHSLAIDEMRLEKELRSGIGKGELRSFYQPILNLDTSGIVGFEALIRWMHPQRALVSPAEFLPLAEKTGLIIDIDRWCMKDALGWLQAMHARFRSEPPLLMNVNLSGKELSQADLVDVVERILRETGVTPACVSLEVTESVMMEDPERAIGILTGLKKLGVKLSLDDFGTGYSSLGYLHKFPLDSVKIDRSFVWNMSASRKNLEIVRTVLRFAENLGMRVVAEGIETREQMQQLLDLGCRYGQGFLFSKPVEASQAERLLSTGFERQGPPGRVSSAAG